MIFVLLIYYRVKPRKPQIQPLSLTSGFLTWWTIRALGNQGTKGALLFFFFKCFAHDSFVQFHSVGCTPYTLLQVLPISDTLERIQDKTGSLS